MPQEATSHQPTGDAQFRLRRLPFGFSVFTMLDGTPDLRWTRRRDLPGAWESAQVVVDIDATVEIGADEVPDSLRAAICEAYASHRQSIPERLAHFTSVADARVRIHCATCGGNGRRDQDNPQLGDNHCATCGGSGRVPCQCDECDARVCETRRSVLERARATYYRWFRGLNVADCWEASEFEEAHEELRERPENLADVLARTIEWLTPTNADAVPEFMWLLEKALKVGYEQNEPYYHPLSMDATTQGEEDMR